MNTHTKIIVGIVALLIGIGVLSMSLPNENQIIENTQVSVDRVDTLTKSGTYESYAPQKIAQAATGDVVLFFHASWCPSCRALNTNIENNLKAIPERVSLLKTDYDKEVELKKKYGVTYQHTLVQVDKDGNMIKKWSGGSTLEKLLSQIQ